MCCREEVAQEIRRDESYRRTDVVGEVRVPVLGNACERGRCRGWVDRCCRSIGGGDETAVTRWGSGIWVWKGKVELGGGGGAHRRAAVSIGRA